VCPDICPLANVVVTADGAGSRGRLEKDRRIQEMERVSGYS
jgi:hypothetical protein